MSKWEEKTKVKEQNLSFFVNGIKILWTLLGKERRKVIYALIWLIFISFVTLLFPYILKLIFDEIPEIASEKKIDDYIIFLIISMFIIRILIIYLNLYSKEIRAIKLMARLENFWPVQAQRKLLSLSLGYHEKENTGKKVSKIAKGCDKLVNIVENLFHGFLPPFFYLIMSVIFILVIDWKLGLIISIPFIPTVLISRQVFKKYAPFWEKWEEKKEVSSGIFHQSLINVQTVQGFAQEDKEKSRYMRIRKGMEKLDIDVSLGQRKYFFLMAFTLNVFFLITIIAGIYFIYLGTSTVGTVVYIIITGNVSLQSFWVLNHVYFQILRDLIAVKRMNELIEEEIDIKNSPNAIIPDKFEGDFRFKDVTFTYPKKKQPVLNSINLDIESKKMTALVGRSGEGKTTIFRLICRMYDIQKGSINLDGADIRDIDLFWYRRLFAIVHQDVDIFDNTINYNIKYPYPKASDKHVQEAIKASYLNTLLKDKERFPKGLNTQVGERGVRLSGGERQRVGIARAYLALLTGAKVLIMDEATSNLDSEAEKAIQRMLAKLKKKMPISIIVVAHRLSTIQKADTIYVINGGKVVEKGDHTRLVRKDGLYSKLVELQKIGDLRE